MQDRAWVPFDEIEMYNSLFPDETNFVSGRGYVKMVVRVAQICQNDPSVLYGKRLRSLGGKCRPEQNHFKRLT